MSDLNYLNQCIVEWNKLVKIVKINSNILEILYHKLMLLNDCEPYKLDLTLQSNDDNHEIILEKLVMDIEISKEKIENFIPKYSSSLVARNISLNILNKYLFHQEGKIESCLNDIITSLNNFRDKIEGISKLVAISTAKMNRNEYQSPEDYEFICRRHIILKSDYYNMLNIFEDLLSSHAQLRLRHYDIEYRNAYFISAIDKLRDQDYTFMINS